MNILPDYLINYMPEIEEALEELRLSVLDHAYELLQRLDVDELSTDEIRQKLELYDIKVDNMSGDWLPNGRFYRLYPSIKHHRTRHNTIKAIAKSGGQFEGLWSTEFSNKSAYEFKNIQVMRHYDLQDNHDGYFFVSGNTTKNAKGQIISSAAQALTTDVLINQALPAGYTYLYIPWPRPVYPGDSSYFYNINMLMYDRLHYANDCNHVWKKYNEYTTGGETVIVYQCLDNSETHRFCRQIKDQETGKLTYVYGDNVNSDGSLVNEHSFDSNKLPDDAPYTEQTYDEDNPASTRYDWAGGSNTPWRAPYWIDYHYMEDMRRSLPSGNSAGTWPIEESGTYYDENNDVALDFEDAVTYVLDDKCKALGDSDSVFPTKCYLKLRHKTTEPNRLQKFTPNNLVLVINNCVASFSNSTFKSLLCGLLHEDASKFDEFINNHYNEIKSSYEVESDVVDDVVAYTLKITLDDLSNFNGKLDVSYFVDDVKINSSIEFEDSVARVSITSDNVRELFVYNFECIVNDSIREKFEQIILTSLPTTLKVYNQSTNVTISNATYLPDDRKIDLHDGNGYIALDDFYANNWIIANDDNKVTVYYGEDSFEIYTDDCTGNIPKAYFSCDYKFEYKHQDSIDENDLTDPDRTFSPKEGPYRWDKLYDGFLLYMKETLHHIKTYRPFWNEKTPWSEMCQSQLYETYTIRLESYDSSRTAELKNALSDLTDLSNNAINSHVSSIPCKLYGIYTLKRAQQIKDALSDVGCTVSYSLNDARSVYSGSELILSGYVANESKLTLVTAVKTIYGIGLYEANNLVNSAPVKLNIPNSGNYNTPLKLIQKIEENCGVVTINNDCAQHSLYNWMNLKQTENRPSFTFDESGLYDLNYNTKEIFTGSYNLVLRVELGVISDRDVWFDLRSAILSVFSGVDISDEYNPNPIIIASSSDKQFLENSINAIHIKYEDITANSGWGYIHFEVTPINRQASVVRDNEPPVSEVTFTSYDRPTRGKLDPVYIGYLSNDIDKQDDNQPLDGASVYIYDNDTATGQGHDPIAIEYDPEYYYTIIGLDYKDNDSDAGQGEITNLLWDASADKQDHIFADFIGDPANRTLKVISKPNSDHHTSLVTVHTITHATCNAIIDNIIETGTYDDVPISPNEIILTDSSTQTIDFSLSQSIPDIYEAMFEGTELLFTGIYSGDVTQENNVGANSLVVKSKPSSLDNISLIFTNTAPSGASDITSEREVPAYNYILFKKSKIHKLWFSNTHKNATFGDTGITLYNFYGDSNIYTYTNNTVSFEYNIIEVYDDHNRPLGFKSGSLRCWSNGRVYFVEANNLMASNDRPITKAAYILFTVKVGPGAVEVIQSNEISTSLHYSLASRSTEIVDTPTAEYTNT